MKTALSDILIFTAMKRLAAVNTLSVAEGEIRPLFKETIENIEDWVPNTINEANPYDQPRGKGIWKYLDQEELTTAIRYLKSLKPGSTLEVKSKLKIPEVPSTLYFGKLKKIINTKELVELIKSLEGLHKKIDQRKSEVEKNQKRFKEEVQPGVLKKKEMQEKADKFKEDFGRRTREDKRPEESDRGYDERKEKEEGKWKKNRVKNPSTGKWEPVYANKKGARMIVPIAHKLILTADIITGKKKKWMQQMTKSKKFEEGALRKYFGLKKGDKITMGMLDKELEKLEKRYPDGGYSKSDLELQKRLQAAKNMMSR